jgi:5,5'-dehydrodivanillate O-demethylase
VLEGGTEQDDDWNVGHPLVFPNMLRVGAGGHHRFEFRLPVDDTDTWHVWCSCDHPVEARAPSQPHIPLYDVPWRDANGEHIERVMNGEDPLGIVCDTAANQCIELPQETDKCGGGNDFLAESLALGCAGYSPIRKQALELLGISDGG